MRISFYAPILIVAAALALSASAFAKLPSLSDEVKARAAETAAKAAWGDKFGGYQLCQAMNRAAEHYRNTAKSTGKEAPAAVETPACSDPGAFAPLAAASAPLEASGAHSPATMATSPPSSNATAAEISSQPKK